MEDTNLLSVRQFDFSPSSIPESLSLSHNEVHVWKARLSQPAQDLQLLEQTLSAHERESAKRFHFNADRVRFIAAHGQLRMILSRYTGIEPRALDFAFERHGKPHLKVLVDSSSVKFNLSRSGDFALIGIAHRNIGIDIEEVHRVADFERIAEEFFTAREHAALRALPESERLEAFFRCWNCKEAYLKATGKGLGVSTKSFDVSPAISGVVREMSIQRNGAEGENWSLMLLEPALGYTGAVVVQSTSSGEVQRY